MVAGRRHVAGGGRGNRSDRTRRPAVALGPGFDGPGALLWILPLSYAWLPVSLVLRALWLAGACVPTALALHALGIGAMGGLMLGMMTRSALGHTGRPLAVGSVETASYVLVHLAAAVRVFVPLAELGAAALAAGISSLLWAAAFSIFLVAYWPVRTRPRVDERPIPKEPANRTAE